VNRQDAKSAGGSFPRRALRQERKERGKQEKFIGSVTHQNPVETLHATSLQPIKINGTDHTSTPRRK
jgi:hypothetical protein